VSYEAPRCPNGHPMRVTGRFRLDHEEGDTERDAESLRMFEAAGIELGASVTLWECRVCDFARADFKYDEEEEHDG
jgi:hypothetical protein